MSKKQSEKRILARFHPQTWINGHAVEIDGAYDFDVTEQVLAMDREKALAIEDDRIASDILWADNPAYEEKPHDGPFYVAVANAIQSYFEDSWNQDAVQFPRLLAEIWAMGLNHEQSQYLCSEMDLDPEDLDSLFERADLAWRAIKQSL